MVSTRIDATGAGFSSMGLLFAPMIPLSEG
jgi:hypothetical protein